ncbi:hypothetical protein AGDE_15329 [Angomonas deanei]|uniref:ATP synthase regulation protein NCA2, putative n=1 Tax=Angomonas deanei TaxID=59799 RepID=A0A7G2C980_9TRYP|nr:hypothetical protein AGDE_15329 [Angomonas deanei]CAD2215601.1 ATP synthase regulation protein NCA2, putative [Angomonas deanei]|eukprot:EPY19256.1 hypothetical protein AGDE_15329 [Angomonas deanei]
MVVAAAITVPPFVWLYRKTPSELESLARSAASYTKHLLRTYLWMPLKQLQESLWYERPGVEDRRNSLTRDAESLSNIIRDYHEDYYPSMAQSKLDDVRDNTFHALKDGVADAGGYALVAEHYRKAVKYPVWNTVFGNLPRIILIQMSLQSLEMSRVTNGIDEVLEGNDLNFKVMAMAPVVMCGSVLALWARRRWGASRHPIERRMKLYWRLVYRVVSYAGTYNAATVNPYSGNYYHYHHYAGGGAATNSNHNNFVNLAKSYNLQRMHSWQLPNVLSGNNLDSAENWINHNNSNHLLGQSVNFSNNNNNMNANSIPVNYQSTPPRSLNNYEKGMLLLLVHIMRCTAEEYLSHYLFYRELIEDLEDLEGMQGDRQVRLETLQRMHVTHRFFLVMPTRQTIDKFFLKKIKKKKQSKE